MDSCCGLLGSTIPTFWTAKLPPSSDFTQKMVATWASKTLVPKHITEQCYIPEDHDMKLSSLKSLWAVTHKQYQSLEQTYLAK